MAETTIRRELRDGGTVVLRDPRCSFTFRRPVAGVLEIAIEGTDDGQFGTAALDEIAIALRRERPLELFVDASRASMPAVSVSQDWTRFFATNQKDLRRVSVLVSSKTVELTIAIAQHLSQTGRLIQIYSDPDAFASASPAREGR